MIQVENLAIRTRDKIELELDRTDFLVRLSGELDIHERRTLQETLSLTLSTGLPTIVDLSEVTFLDLRCARELVTRSRLYDHLTLSDPSWQAKVSLEVYREAAYPLEGSSLRNPLLQAQAV